MAGSLMRGNACRADVRGDALGAITHAPACAIRLFRWYVHDAAFEHLGEVPVEFRGHN